MTDKTEKMTFRILDLLLGVLVASTAGVLTWTVKNQMTIAKDISHVRERLVAIEANRFTAGDGLDIWKEVSTIRHTIAALPTEVPPQWFVQKVDKLENRQDQILNRLSEIERRLP